MKYLINLLIKKVELIIGYFKIIFLFAFSKVFRDEKIHQLSLTLLETNKINFNSLIFFPEFSLKRRR